MNINTRSKARKHEMTSESAHSSSRKLDDILVEQIKQVGDGTKYNYQGCGRLEE